eukprot:jgi/Ulvmu1/8639/UM046_0044.1
MSGRSIYDDALSQPGDEPPEPDATSAPEVLSMSRRPADNAPLKTEGQRRFGRFFNQAASSTDMPTDVECAVAVVESAKQERSYAYAPNHPFMNNNDVGNNIFSHAAAGTINAAGGGGGYTVDPDSQGCCSGSCEALVCCCGACDGGADGGCCEDCGNCCMAVVSEPFTCIGGLFSWVAECMGGAGECCVGCVRSCAECCLDCGDCCADGGCCADGS